ncbi:MAG: MlaC/ttg2D family ABC transporter substrate-binding protein [Acidiferrobacteraceae bacterium]
MKRLTIMLMMFLGCASVPAFAAPVQNPQVLVREKTTQILALISKKRSIYAHDPAKLYAMVRRRVLPYFDFRLMSRWVLGRYWMQATPQQKQEFMDRFQALLVRTYATALLGYGGEKIIYLPFHGNLQGRTVMVRTLVQQNNGGPDIPVDYSFSREPDGWKVYDVSIDRVSLVTNYRMTYANKIQREGLPALIKSMKYMQPPAPR